jgi:dihydrofolate reductase
MGKLIVTEFVTLDGVAQAPAEPDGGFTHGGWHAPLLDQESFRVMFEQARSMDALLLGRRTYEIFANYWPSAPEEIPPARWTRRRPTLQSLRTRRLRRRRRRSMRGSRPGRPRRSSRR